MKDIMCVSVDITLSFLVRLPIAARATSGTAAAAGLSKQENV